MEKCSLVSDEKKGTLEGIFNLRTVLERYLVVLKDVYVCFIDYEKAFDRVYHVEIMKVWKGLI